MMRILLLALIAAPVGAQTAADCAARPTTFGCANLANLAAMVADPADLDHGRPLAPLAGDPAVAAVARYRTGLVTPLPASGTDGADTGAPAPAPPVAPQ
jgi:type IV pilus biogenesis protein CpaD/CtpE